MVEYMDKLVGRLVSGLDDLGLRENTLVLFYSDNGTHLKVTSLMNGKRIAGGKATPLQTGIRVPLVANWPGVIDSGRISNDLIDASDFLPTFANLAGKTIPSDWHQDGQKLPSSTTRCSRSETRLVLLLVRPPTWVGQATFLDISLHSTIITNCSPTDASLTFVAQA